MKNFFYKYASISLLVFMLTLYSNTATQAGGSFAEPPKPVIWSGFYVGGHLGGLFVDHDADFGEEYSGSKKFGPFKLEYGKKVDEDADDAIGGFHLGYNIQRGKFIFGIEGDYSLTDADIGVEHYSSISNRRGKKLATGYGSLDIDADYFASVRARAGYSAGKALLYATGGVAFTEVDARVTVGGKLGKTASADYTIYSESEELTGFVVGGGGEYKLHQNINLRGEVLYYDFDEDDIDFDATVVRGGLSFQFQ